MPRFLYNFGYETPAAEDYNNKHGTDDEFSKAILIEAETEAQALE